MLPEPDADLGLGDVVFLAWTTRAPEGLLGHALTPDTLALDPLRRVVDGEGRWVDTKQHLRLLLSREASLEVGARVGVVGADAKLGQATHVLYDVELKRYYELPPASLRYAAASGCCLGGRVAAACGVGYAVRLMWGSGRAEYLRQVDAKGGLSGVELVRARGGTLYRRLTEIEFEDTFFAYETVPLADLCARVRPEEEVEALAVAAPVNCRAHAFADDGARRSHAWHTPDEALCSEVALRYCRSRGTVLACHVTYGTGDGVRTFTVPEPVTAAPAPAVEPPPDGGAPTAVDGGTGAPAP